MKARPFGYVRASTVDDALGSFADAGETAAYIAGGQSLVPSLSLRLQAPELLIDIAHIAALRGIEVQGDWLRIGALTRHCEMLTDPLIARQAPLFCEAAPHVAHPAIRNKGTIGGSIAHADPAAEFPAMALAMGAELEVASRQGSRRVAADDFFIDLFETAMAPGELLVAIHVPLVRSGQRWAFGELARRRGDFALVGAGILADFRDGRVSEIHVVFFSVGNTPVRAPGVEAVLTGRDLTGSVVVEAQSAVNSDLSPPEDANVPPAMRLHLARVLLGRLLGRIKEPA